MKTWIHWIRVFGISLSACLSLVAGAAAQVVFNVNSTLDKIDDDTSDGVCHTAADTCTLRAAVMQANVMPGVGATIVLPPGTYLLTRPATGVNGPDSGDLDFTTPTSANPILSIVGAGPSSTIIDGNQIDRVLEVHSFRTASLSGVTVRNGFLGIGPEQGGGVRNSGTLTLDRCTVSGNALGAGLYGGGIYSSGVLNLIDSTISGNSGFQGGGIFNSSAGLVSIVRTTISGNEAQSHGGGISSHGAFDIRESTIGLNTSHGDGGGFRGQGGLTMIQTTVYGNSADGSGGGIHLTGTAPANVFNSTIADNGADADADPNGGNGGGVYVAAGSSFHMRNTLLVGNTLFNAPIYDDCWGTVNSYGRNLFWEPGDGCTIVIQSGSAWLLNSLDDLGLLQSNGGPTETVALRPGSNAIDGGDPELGCIGPDLQPFTTDQRGAARAVGARCDLGAYEAGTLFFDGFESGDLTAW